MSHLLSLSALHAAAPGVLSVVLGSDGDFEGAPQWTGPLTSIADPWRHGWAVWRGLLRVSIATHDGFWSYSVEDWRARWALDCRIPSVAARLAGLLRRGSPVLIDFWRSEGHDDFHDEDSDERPEDYLCRGNVYEVEDDALFVAWSQSEAHEGGFDEIHRDWMALDLTDVTGRAQAAAWADKATTYNTVEFIQRLEAGMLPSLDERHAMDLGMRFADMTAREIDTLARLCLRLAGRSHV